MLRQVSAVAMVVQTVKVPPGQTCDVLVRSSGLRRGEEAVVEPDVAMLSSVGLVGVRRLMNCGACLQSGVGGSLFDQRYQTWPCIQQ